MFRVAPHPLKLTLTGPTLGGAAVRVKSTRYSIFWAASLAHSSAQHRQNKNLCSDRHK